MDVEDQMSIMNTYVDASPTSANDQSQRQDLPIPAININQIFVQQAVAASGSSNKLNSDNDDIPNTKKKRTSIEDRCQNLRNELKESKGNNLKIKKHLSNQLKGLKSSN